MGKDKLVHIVVSAIIMVVLGWFMPTWVAVLATLCVGIAKEVYDKVSGKGCFVDVPTPLPSLFYF